MNDDEMKRYAMQMYKVLRSPMQRAMIKGIVRAYVELPGNLSDIDMMKIVNEATYYFITDREDVKDVKV